MDPSQPSSPEHARRPLALARVALLLLIAPAALVGQAVFSGLPFLPRLPVAEQPLAGEFPDAAAASEEGANLILTDRLFPFLTDQLAMREEFLAGRFPGWEPDLGLGVPLFAGSIAGPAYPPNLLATLLPPATAAGPLAALTLILAGLGAWLFLGRLEFTRGARVIGTLGFQFGAWGVANLFYFMKVDAALWLPWSLWAVEGMARGRRHCGPILSATVALSFLAGFIPVAVFSLATASLYAVVRLRARAALPLAFALGGVLCTAWVQWPTVEDSLSSRRLEQTAAKIEGESIPVGTSLGILVPDLFGRPDVSPAPGGDPMAWLLTPAEDWSKAQGANPLEWNAFVGVVLLLLAVAAIAGAPRRAAFPALMLLAAYGFAQAWPPLHLLYHLPGLGLGAPQRVLAVTWFLWPWLAAVGVDATVRGLPRARTAFTVVSFALAAVSFLTWSQLEPASAVGDIQQALVERYAEARGTPATDVLTQVPLAATEQALTRLVTSLTRVFAASLACLAAAILALVLHRPRGTFGASAPTYKVLNAGAIVLLLSLAPLAAGPWSSSAPVPPAWIAIAAAVACGAAVWTRTRAEGLALWLPLALALIAEGVLGSTGHVSGRQTSGLDLFPPSATIDAIASATGDGRVVRLDESGSGVADVVGLARPNLLQAYGISDLTPYTVFTPRTLSELLEQVDGRTRYRSGVSRIPTVESIDHPILDLLRVTCVLSARPIQHPRLEQFLSREGFHVYHRKGAMAPARIVHNTIAAGSDDAGLLALRTSSYDANAATLLSADDLEAPNAAGQHDLDPGTLTFERPNRNMVRVAVDDSPGGWLVVHDQYHPGWSATVNGVATTILRADHAFRAVPIPAGNSVVEMNYRPPGLLPGLALSILACIGIVLLARKTQRPLP